MFLFLCFVFVCCLFTNKKEGRIFFGNCPSVFVGSVSHSAATAAEYRTLFLRDRLFWKKINSSCIVVVFYIHPRPDGLVLHSFVVQVCNTFSVAVEVLMSTPPFSSSYFSFVFVLTDSSPILSSSRFATCFEHWQTKAKIFFACGGPYFFFFIERSRTLLKENFRMQ